MSLPSHDKFSYLTIAKFAVNRWVQTDRELSSAKGQIDMEHGSDRGEADG